MNVETSLVNVWSSGYITRGIDSDLAFDANMPLVIGSKGDIWQKTGLLWYIILLMSHGSDVTIEVKIKTIANVLCLTLLCRHNVCVRDIRHDWEHDR